MEERAPDEDAPKRPPRVKQLCVVGLGLVGGSVARAVRAHAPDVKLYGVDREVILEVAREQGIVDEGSTAEGCRDALAGSDVVLLSLPVRQIEAFLEEHRAPLSAGAAVTDTGSTKVVIERAAQKAGITRFVGGHPMAGKPQGGLAHAEAGLFHGATWFLCPSASAEVEAVTAVRRFVRELGARPVEIDAEEHDRAVAITSHLPHVLVNALCEAVLEENVLEAAGGSLRRVVEIAGAPFSTWADILATNQAVVEVALREMGTRLFTLADQLAEEGRLRDLFARGRACRERVLAQKGED